jgi:hypothetical protein
MSMQVQQTLKSWPPARARPVCRAPAFPLISQQLLHARVRFSQSLVRDRLVSSTRFHISVPKVFCFHRSGNGEPIGGSRQAVTFSVFPCEERKMAYVGAGRTLGFQ